MNAPIVLTDTPEVVKLKREFRQLDEREEALKAYSQGAVPPGVADVSAIRQRKAEIAGIIAAIPTKREPLFAQVGLRHE